MASRKICAFITGGASGLGRATVERLAKRGANVIIADLPSSNGEEVAKNIGPNVLFHPTDVSFISLVLYQCSINLHLNPLDGSMTP